MDTVIISGVFAYLLLGATLLAGAILIGDLIMSTYAMTLGKTEVEGVSGWILSHIFRTYMFRT